MRKRVNNALNEKKWAKTVKNRQNYEGKISEYPVNMVAQASKYGRSFRNLFQSLNEKNIPYFFCETLHQQWELLVQNMLCDLQELVTKFVHKITDMNNPKEKMK